MLLPIAVLLATAVPQDCPLPATLKGWSDVAERPVIGHAFDVRGADPSNVRGLTPAEIARGGMAALVPFEVDRDGTYRVAIGDKAWIDVLNDNQPVPAVGHAHGTACSGIHKIVDFRLRRGRYALHLSGMIKPTVRMMIARA
jgi:hypothetical protein